MKVLRIENDAQGDSYFSDHEWVLQEGSFTPPSPAGYLTTPQMASDGFLMMHHPAGYEDEWHTAPAPVFGVVLTGKVCIQTSDLQTRILEVGDQFLACDLSGKGHRMSEVNNASYDLALVVLKCPPATKALTR